MTTTERTYSRDHEVSVLPGWLMLPITLALSGLTLWMLRTGYKLRH